MAKLSLKKKRAFKKTPLDVALTAINIVVLTGMCFMVIYPFWTILVQSFMTDQEIIGNSLALWTWHPQISGFKTIFTNPVYNFSRAFLNSVIVTVVDTVYQLAITACTAYTLSRKNLPGKKVLLFYFVFTMYFGGGLVPYYLVISELGLRNKLAVMIIPSFISVYNMLIIRSYFVGFPKELEEAACIDGANKLQIFIGIVIPLSGAILATIALFIAIGQWNNWYTAMLFITDLEKRPMAYALQVIIERSKGTNSDIGGQIQVVGKSIQYAAIVVTIIPVMIVYPFFQKYFVKGVMIGSLKD
ncbi:MAG: carbohydrate ABC transporter permease [Clostridia bacterium]|nr:carbohydrate ABC transporter permease [Clostridia bacterium]